MSFSLSMASTKMVRWPVSGRVSHSSRRFSGMAMSRIVCMSVTSLYSSGMQVDSLLPRAGVFA
jgi:hypothetical protein